MAFDDPDQSVLSNELSNSAAPQKSRHGVSPIVPLLIWLAVQLLALLMAVMRIPMSARFHQPAEDLAVEMMVVSQVAASAMLFPLLMRDGKTTLILIAASWPFAQLAGFLSNVPPMRMAAASLYVSTWLAALGIWRAALPSQRSQLIGIAVATILSLGGPLLAYLRLEFSSGKIDPRLLGPVVAAIGLSRSAFPSLIIWLLPMILIALGSFAFFISQRRAGIVDDK